MHEMSIMDAVLTTVDESARQAGATRVIAIHLVVGELTQIVEQAMNVAFDVLSKGTLCEGAQLDMQFVRARSRCTECGCEFEHDPWQRQCPQCGNMFCTALGGDEMLIENIEVELPD